MHLIHQALVSEWPDLPRVRIAVGRLTLAKRRWRGVAEDGAEFGFTLEHPLRDGDAVLATETAVYVVAQKYEPVLELRIGSPMHHPPLLPSASSADCGLRIASDAARLGWMIGNLHFPLEIDGEVVRVEDDVALRQLFEREGIPFVACKRVFHPLSGGHRH